MFRLGPMKREQATTVYIPDAKPEDLPESFLFLDVDRNYHEPTIRPTRPWSAGSEQLSEISRSRTI